MNSTAYHGSCNNSSTQKIDTRTGKQLLTLNILLPITLTVKEQAALFPAWSTAVYVIT